jgi:hypothetical protein
MSSAQSSIHNHRLTGGHLISLGVTNAHMYPVSAYIVPPSSGTGYVNAQGSVFNYTTATNALNAAIAANPTASDVALTAGIFLEDMGDRLVFSALGQTVLIFAKVRRLNDIDTEGSETQHWTCIWAASPAASGTDYQAIVGVARL